ncbi:MAG: tetratricopeptide repeat protein [Ardenticatenaceae bacterium]|nr:tetratricopeptide repeat protein [Ardenticatenaceae bacterium]
MAQNRALYEKALEKGFQYNADENWSKAMGAFRAAISEFPKQPMPYVGLGEACFGLKQLDKALDCYKLAARYSGGDLSYLRKVADLQERMGLLTEAGRTYMAAGELLLQRKKYEEAIDMWQLAVRLEPGLLAAHRRLAMIFQRQNLIKDAVREYLAIARILQERGNGRKALQMCQAAQRLDPDNDDVLMAVKLILGGEAALAEPEELEEPVDETPLFTDSQDGVTQMVRQMASVFAAEQEAQQAQQTQQEPLNPLEKAHQTAQDLLAAEVFREEDDVPMSAGLSKLERDALIGQGLDFEARGNVDDAVSCYEKAIQGGLRIPAAFFTLGLLYLKQDRRDVAQKALGIAAKDAAFREASKLALNSNQ